MPGLGLGLDFTGVLIQGHVKVMSKSFKGQEAKIMNNLFFQSFVAKKCSTRLQLDSDTDSFI